MNGFAGAKFVFAGASCPFVGARDAFVVAKFLFVFTRCGSVGAKFAFVAAKKCHNFAAFCGKTSYLIVIFDAEKEFFVPINNLTSYLPTMQEFMDHWTLVNAQLGVKPLVLSDGTSLATFTASRTAIQGYITAVTQAETLVPQKRQTLHDLKKAMSRKLELFRKAVLGQLATSNYVSRLPTLPKFGATQARFIKPLEAAANIWSSINYVPPLTDDETLLGFVGPLILPDGTALADFQAAITALYAAYSAITTAQVKVGNALSQRDAALKSARRAMKQYRVTVYARLAPTDMLLTRVPRLSPVAGATQKAVTNVLSFYKATDNTLELTFDPSTSKNIAQYELWFCPDAKWNAANTQMIASNLNAPPFAFQFTYTQVALNSVGLFKVYAKNETGNTKASKVVSVRRTAAEARTALRLAA